MNDVQIFNNAEFGEIRAVNIDGEPWFVAKDIAEKLGYVKTANMTKLIDEDDRRTVDTKDLIRCSNKEHQVYKQNYQIGVINESGLYAAIFGSKQENARKFKKWVTSEVLPAIRKTGGYQAQLPQTTDGQIKLLAQGYVKLQEKIETVSQDVDSMKVTFESFQEDCPMFPVETDKIVRAVKKKGVSCMGGKDSNAYHDRGLVQAVYHDIYGQIHRNFECSSYKEIPRRNIDKVLSVVDSYILPVILMEKVDGANAQMVMDL